MGWLYKQSIGPYKTAKEYLNHQFTFESETASYKVLRSALVGMRRYYAAVERVTKESQTKEVSCVVCLVNYNPRDKEGYIFGYKDMDETMYPFATDCPAAILDLLTPTDSENAMRWRAECRRRLSKQRPKNGDTIVLSKPMKFTNQTMHARFRVVELAIGRRRKMVFAGDDGNYYRLGNLKDLDYTIEARVVRASTVQAPSLLERLPDTAATE